MKMLIDLDKDWKGYIEFKEFDEFLKKINIDIQPMISKDE